MSGRAVVLGAGIAGLSATIALRQAGYDVVAFEHAPALEPSQADRDFQGDRAMLDMTHRAAW